MVKDFLRNGTKKIEDGIGAASGGFRTYARPAAAIRSRAGTGQGRRGILETRLCGTLARRSRRGDGHEPAELVRGLRRQTRPLPENADALSAAIARDRRADHRRWSAAAGFSQALLR